LSKSDQNGILWALLWALTEKDNLTAKRDLVRQLQMGHPEFDIVLKDLECAEMIKLTKARSNVVTSEGDIPTSQVIFSKPKGVNQEKASPYIELTGQESEITSQMPEVVTTEINKPRIRVMSHESVLMENGSEKMKIDPLILEQFIVQGCKDPRISTYSPLVMSVLKYLKKTIPDISMSEVASTLLEDAIRERYPEISKQEEKTLVKK
jgi:hypothetical protein